MGIEKISVGPRRDDDVLKPTAEKIESKPISKTRIGPSKRLEKRTFHNGESDVTASEKSEASGQLENDTLVKGRKPQPPRRTSSIRPKKSGSEDTMDANVEKMRVGPKRR